MMQESKNLSVRNNSNTCLIVLHEIYGINEHINGVCKNFTKMGYDVVCPDLLDGKVFPYDKEEEAYLHFKNNIGFGPAQEQVTELLTREDGNFKRVILLGYSIGATVAWLLSENLQKCDGVIGYYGSRIRDYTKIDPKCPTLLIFPKEEKSFDLKELQEELIKKQMVEVHILDGTHGFADSFSKKYNVKSSDAANRIAEEFLQGYEKTSYNNFK